MVLRYDEASHEAVICAAWGPATDWSATDSAARRTETSSSSRPVGQVHPSVLPGGPSAMTTYIGPYDAMEPAYTALASWVSDRGGEPTGGAWEIYSSDPE